MKIYCFSGLGADERVFGFLKLNLSYELIPVRWIKPIEGEVLEEYSKRISKNIQTTKSFGILGISFGGVVAQEVSKLVKPKFTLLISSINSPIQIPFLLKVTPSFVLRIVPASLLKPPSWIANYMFSAKNKKVLQKILLDTDPHFVKWALIAFKNWKPKGINLNCFFISGLKDRIFKPTNEGVKIQNGGHFMVVDLANEVSEEINYFLKCYPSIG